MDLLALYASLALVGGLIALWRMPQLPHWCPLLAFAALPQLVSLWGVRSLVSLAITAGIIAVWCWRNRTIAGVPLVTLGIGMNLLAMALHNGAMPIDSATLASMGHHVTTGTALIGSKDVVVAASPVWMLSDWMLFMSPVTTLVASPGDVFVLVGLVWWLCFSRQRKGNTQR